MSTHAAVISVLLSNFLVLLSQAATITLFTPAISEPTGGPQVSTEAETNSIIGVSAVDVLPGNVTEYAVGIAETIFSEVGTGTPASVSASTTTFSFTIQEGASFFGNSLNFDEFTLSGTQTISTPITGVVGCTATVPTSATEADLRCAQVQVFNGTKTETFLYTASAVPYYTLTESTPPPTASATTNILFPTGVPVSNGSKQLRSGSRGVLLALIVSCSVAFI
ncbi:hypothetical protein CPB84DRAFT_1854355 [Gymnopilus junonius]|uniref:Uncharacterized protein n=1 Tax=Gymnopilus junonius TaxID=109634 RepID=A0A9P5TGM7_GYMJU|nr:hypothetical protein CPB84DRAFT_1854355 [Gymnopilus junonius]